LKPVSEQISDYLIPWPQMDWPLDLQSLYPTELPLVLEIGFGDGSFLIDQATRFPERNYVGIELAWDPIQRLFKKIERLGLNNIRVLRCDAQHAIDALFQTETFTEVFINHPDPWPKERHHGRRLLQRGFIKQIAAVLAPECTVTIATDHADYAAWITEILESQDELVNTLSATSVPTLEDRLVTRYQQKAQAVGIGNHFFIWRRAMETVDSTPIRKMEDMPNVALQGTVDLDAVFQDFNRQDFQERHQNVDVMINLVRVFKQHGQDHYFVETRIKEGRFSQQIGVNILLLESEKITIKTSAMGYPRATWGTKRAIWHVSRYLLARAPHLTIVNTTVGNLLD
jgi:tRNA (guanine-N7-)-methyltransferase